MGSQTDHDFEPRTIDQRDKDMKARATAPPQRLVSIGVRALGFSAQSPSVAMKGAAGCGLDAVMDSAMMVA